MQTDASCVIICLNGKSRYFLRNLIATDIRRSLKWFLLYLCDQCLWINFIWIYLLPVFCQSEEKQQTQQKGCKFCCKC